MIQKVVMVLLTVITMIASSITPVGLFGAEESAAVPSASRAADVVREEVFTRAHGSAERFARVSVLSVTVDGRDVFDDAFGTGTLGAISFKVGVKRAEGATLVLGGGEVALKPMDTITIRNFHGKFEFKDPRSSAATIALDGTVETTVVAQGELVKKVQTSLLPADSIAQSRASPGTRVDLAYVTLDTGGSVETVSWESAGAGRLFTWGPDVEDAEGEAASIPVKWLKIDDRPITQYSWGDGVTRKIEFEPAERATLGSLLNWSGDAFALQPRKSVVITDFVGAYVAFEALGGGMKLRLDGYAGNFVIGEPQPMRGLPGNNLAPTPLIDYSPKNPSTSDYVSFVDKSEDEDGVIVFREWTFKDSGQTSILPNPKHKFTTPGRWAVTLEVTDNGLASWDTTVYVDVANTGPVSDWDYHPKDVYAFEDIRFEDKSWDPDNATGPVWREWDLGDGSPKRAEASFTHAYAKHGNYTVTLSVEDAHGARDALTKVVVVKNRPPLPSFEFTPSSPLSQVDVRFTDTSTDTDGAITCWEWDFGDGTTATVQHPVKRYGSPGSYFVNLTVCDDGGGRASTGTSLPVENRPPRPDWQYSPLVDISTSTTVQFQDLSNDPDGNIVEWRWNFGDGSPPDTRPNPQHRYLTSGVFSTCLTVSDDRDADATSCRTIPVDNSAPHVKFRWTPESVEAPVTNQSVAFTDQTTDPDGDGLVAWSWTFGDGNGSSDRNPVHRYRAKGTFPVALKVTDAKGKVGEATKSLVVRNDRPTLSFTHAPALPTTRDDVRFNATAEDRDGAIASVVWNFSDGTPEASGAVVTHRFATPGTYKVTVTATDDDGATRTVSKDVTVKKSEPIVDFTMSPHQNPAPKPGDVVQFTDRTTPGDVAIVNWTWAFGDGGSSTQQNPVHSYGQPGNYSVKLSVRDAEGKTFNGSKVLRVNRAPQAAFLANRTSIGMGDSVHFTDQSTDRDGSIVDWTWDWGDGSPLTTGRGPHDHAFTAPGSHVVKLTVKDDDGVTASATRLINVANRAPLANFDYAPTSPRRAESVQFTDRSVDPDAPHDAVESWEWAFGEPGRKSTEQNPRYAYETSGVKTVKLVASDGLATGTKEKSFRVMGSDEFSARICSRLPDGRLLDHARPIVSFYGNLTRPTGWGAPLALQKASPGVSVEVGGCLRVAIGPGSWAEGDRFTFTVSVDGTSDSGSVNPQDDATTVERELRIPLRLDANVRVLPGGNAPLLAPPVDLRAPGVAYRYPTYADQTEAVEVEGNAIWRDGVPAVGVTAGVMLRYIGARALMELPDVASNPVTGWCQAGGATTGAGGAFTAAIRYVPSCFNLFADDGAFLPGWYQVRVIASCPACDPVATPGVSETVMFYEDPLGVATGRVGFPDPP